MAAETESDDWRRWHDDDGEHLDLRGLQPPQPLVKVLRLLPELQATGRSLLLHLDRDPVMLYPELEELGWTALPAASAQGEIRLQLLPPAP